MCVSSWTPPSSPGRDVEMGYLFNSDAGEEFPWGVFDLGCLNCHFNRLGIRYSVPHARTEAGVMLGSIGPGEAHYTAQVIRLLGRRLSQPVSRLVMQTSGCGEKKCYTMKNYLKF